MEATCASFHALRPGSVADAAKAVSCAYARLGGLIAVGSRFML